MSLQFTLVKNLVGATGSAGRTIYNSTGAPSSGTGTVGDFYIDTQAYVLYGPKLAVGSWSGAGQASLIGPQGASTPQTLPSDFVANSFVVAPVSGDATLVQFRLNNASGTQQFLVDASGNVTAAGNLSVSGTASTGALTAASATVSGNTSVGGTLSASGQTTLAATSVTSLTDSGALSVTGASTLGATSVTSLTDSGNLTVSGTASLASISATSLSLSGTLSVTGTSTLGTTSTGALTATSLTSTGPTQSTGHIVTSNGTAGAPAFSFLSQQDTGLYLVTASTSAAVMGLSVNGIQALSLARGGISVPGTLNAVGATTLGASLSVTGAITGSSTLGITGAITGGSTLTVTGAAAAATVAVTQGSGTDTNGNVVSSVKLPGAFGGTSSYPASGLSSDSFGNLLFNYQGRTVFATANTGYNAGVGNTPATAFGINFTAGAYTFGAGGATALLIGGSGSVTIGGGLSGNNFPCIITQQAGTILSLRQNTNVVGTFDTTGNATFSNVVTSGGFTLSTAGTKITFGDNSVQTTAYTSTLANNQAKWIATTQGTTTLPAFTFTANTDTGLYLKGTSATSAILALSVNAADTLLMTSLQVTVPGILNVTGATAASTVTASGLVKAAAVTITASGGALTFGDGTTQTTAAASNTAGSAATFTATSAGTTSAPSFTFSTSTSSGMWYINNSLAFSQAGTSVLTLSSTIIATQGTIPFTCAGAATFNTTAKVTGVLTALAGIALTGSIVASGSSVAIQGGIGSATAPAITAYNTTNTGIFFNLGSVSNTGTASSVDISVNGTQTAVFTSTGALQLTGPVSATNFQGTGAMTTASITATSLFSANSSGAVNSPQFTSYNNQTGLWVASGSLGLCVGSASVLTATNTGITVPLASIFTGATTHAATVTSTTAAGTPSFVSTQGFKAVRDAGTYYTQATAAPTAYVQMNCPVVDANTGAAFAANKSFVATHAGSVVGFSAYVQNALTSAVTIRLNVNGTVTTAITIAAGSGTASAVFAKGTYPVAANGYVFMQVMSAAASAGAAFIVNGDFTYEMGA